MLGSSGKNDRIELAAYVFDRYSFANLRVDDKRDPLSRHLLEAAVDDVLFQLEFWNPIAQQTANAVGLFVDRNGVTRAAELLCGRQSRGTGTDDCDFFTRARFCGLRPDPSLEKSPFHNVLLVLLDRHGRLV